MYQQVISSETIVDLTTTAKQYLRLLNNTAEDALITEQLTVALKTAEQICNRAFSAKSMVIKSDKSEFALLGCLDTAIAIVAKVDGVVTTEYEIIGEVQPSIKFSAIGGIYQVEYSTKADMPVGVKQWIYQKTAQLFERNSEDSREPDNGLIEPYINLVWLP